eukprot:g1808.t1
MSKKTTSSIQKSPLVTLLITLMEHRHLSNCLKECGIELCIYLCQRIDSMLKIEDDKNTSRLPWQLEECQESISIIYFIVSRFAHFMLNKSQPEMIRCVSVVSNTMFWILKNDVLAREALPSAGVALWKVITLPGCNPTWEAQLLVGAYCISPAKLPCKNNNLEAVPFIQQELELNGSSLIHEFHGFSKFGRICSLRGVLSIIEIDALTQFQDNEVSVLKNTLHNLCDELRTSNDINLCFHLLCAISTTLERLKLYLTAFPKNIESHFTALEDTREDSNGATMGKGMLISTADFEFVFSAIWRHVDDTVVQTERQAINVFNLLMEVIELQHSFLLEPSGQILHKDEALELVLDQISSLGHLKKGKYVLISSIVAKHGALALTRESPVLLNSILSSFSEGSVCRAAGNCLFTLLKALRMETKDDQWTNYWLRPLLSFLQSTNEVLQSNLITYFLPQLFKLDHNAFRTILKTLLETTNECPNALIALVSVLKIARQEAIIPDLQSIVDCTDKGALISVPSSLLLHSIRHDSETLHVCTLELACIHPKPSEFCDEIDYQIVKEAFQVRSRAVRQGARAKWITLIERFLTRLHIAIKASKSHSSSHQIASCSGNGAFERSKEFLKWLLVKLVHGLYPGASSERKILSMECLTVLHRIWGVKALPYSDLGTSLTVQEITLIVIGCVQDPWDYMRSKTIECLESFMSPLPGLTTPEELIPVLEWSCSLITSPRLRDNDAGARLLVLLFKKYTITMKWSIVLKPVLVVSISPHEDAQIEFINSLFVWFRLLVEEAEINLLKTCKQGLAHGVLLTLRYTIEAMDWRSLISNEQNSSGLRSTLDAFFAVSEICSSLCLSVLSNHDVNIGADDEGDALDEILGPHAQLLATGTWLTIKELSVVFATIIHNIPFSNADSGLLEFKDCEKLGRYYLKTLTELKHNGAVEKTGSSFQVVCEQLLLNPNEQFCRFPYCWMEYFIDRIKQKNQSWNDIIRRSGGVPYGLAGIFQAEPKTNQKVLLPHGLKILLEIGTGRDEFDPWTRIHVFHIIRHIFNDKQLALDGASFISKGFMMCVDALSDTSWEVRNAASLCFATFATRMVGYKNRIGSGMSQKSISVFEFFFRYPSLLPFLSKELESAGEVLKDAMNPVPPSLGPILLLLARLVPVVKAPVLTKAAPDPSGLISVIQRCLEVPQFAVRKLAADALVTLISKEKVIHHIKCILTNLVPASNNSLHGNILAVRKLLSVHSDLQKQMIENQVLSSLKDALWVISDRAIAGIVRTEFIDIFKTEDWMLEQDLELKTRLQQMASRLLFNQAGDSRQDPTCVLFLKSCVWYTFHNGLPSLLEMETLLNHSLYEIQTETLKFIIRKIKDAKVSKVQSSWMEKLLLDQLGRSRSPKVKSKCLVGLNELFRINEQSVDVLLYWNTLTDLYISGNLLKIKERSLLCLAYLVRKLTQGENSLDESNSSLQTFVGFVCNSSKYNSPISMRLEACKSLESSQLLQVNPVNATKAICGILLECWKLLFHFLEDEEIEIRRKASMIFESLQTDAGTVCGRHTSLIQKDFFRLLNSRFKPLDGCTDLLMDWILHTRTTAEEVDISLELTSRLFDKEEDNRHEEVLLRSQLAASALQDIQLENSLISEHTAILIEQLNAKQLSLKAVQAKDSWAVLTTHKVDVFVPLYQTLLGVWIMLRNNVIQDSWKNDVSSLLSSFEALKLHPFLRRLVERIKEVINETSLEATDGYSKSVTSHELLFLI